MKFSRKHIPTGTRALIFSKYYYGVLSKRFESLEVDRYFSILYFLKENDGCSQQFICNHLAIDKTAMVKVIDYLIKAGYVQRHLNPADRRQHFIKLTAKGLNRTEEIALGFEKLDKELFAQLPKDQKVTFLQVLDSLTDRLMKIPGNDLFFNYKKTQKAIPKDETKK